MKEKYIPGEGCQCSARCSCECGCDVDWTPREVYDLREQLDEANAEIEKLKEELEWQAWTISPEIAQSISDTPETDAEHAQFPMGGFTLDFARKLERERDRLAEAIRKHRDELELTSGGSVDRILWNTLEAVEGGSYDN